MEGDLDELERELGRERDQAKDMSEKKSPKQALILPHLPRRSVAHDPADSSCGSGEPMQRNGDVLTDKLDYASFTSQISPHFLSEMTSTQAVRRSTPSVRQRAR